MIFGFFLLGIIGAFYFLLVQGMLWKIIVALFGWFGMFICLKSYFPKTNDICIIVCDYGLSWAKVIPVIIIILAMFYTKED